MKRPIHETVEIRCPWLEGDRPIAIDVDLVPLIEGLWRHEIRTAQCCQEHAPGLVWIAFLDTEAAWRFIAAVGLDEINDADYEDWESLPSRAINPQIAASDATYTEPWYWKWSAHPECDGTFSIAVEFPRTDLPELNERIAKRTPEQLSAALERAYDYE